MQFRSLLSDECIKVSLYRMRIFTFGLDKKNSKEHLSF